MLIQTFLIDETFKIKIQYLAWLCYFKFIKELF